MKKDVLITIKGMLVNMPENENIEMIVTGTLYEKDNKYYINYIDTSLDSEFETKTSVKINNEKVSITRFGALSTHMIFEKDVSHYSPYETPFGIFEIKTHTKNINIEKDDNNLKLGVEYILEVNKMSSGISYFELNARDI